MSVTDLPTWQFLLERAYLVSTGYAAAAYMGKRQSTSLLLAATRRLQQVQTIDIIEAGQFQSWKSDYVIFRDLPIPCGIGRCPPRSGASGVPSCFGVERSTPSLCFYLFINHQYCPVLAVLQH